ncbi:MAG: hypothetical protein WAV23_01985 [Minisyncoccia bacterium]
MNMSYLIETGLEVLILLLLVLFYSRGPKENKKEIQKEIKKEKQRNKSTSLIKIGANSENFIDYFKFKSEIDYKKIENKELQSLLEISINEEDYEKSILIRDEFNRRIEQEKLNKNSQLKN